ncbi:MAG: recombinase family protein [Clostridia bacterium]|nr:recombinase family protein [Clostridia bacterium]
MYNYIDFSTFSPEEILVYLRKSRSDDPLMTVEEVLSNHETILDEWAERNIGAKVPEKNKFREIVSGETIADRPEVQKLLRLIESPKYKAVLIVEVQRLSRGDLEDAGRLIKLFRYTNTLVITPPKTYDIRDEYDRDAFERELKRGNEFLEYQKKIMNRGRLLSVSQGNYLGSHPPYGFDRAWVMDGKRKCPTLKENKEQADVVRMIFDMYVNQNMGGTNICHKLDDLGIAPPTGGKHWSPAYLKDLLDNVHYIGKVKWYHRKGITTIEGGEVKISYPKAKMGEYLIYEGRHEGIISEELFNAAQEKKGRNHRAKPNTKIRNPLAGLLYCQCGRAMSLRTYKNKDGSERNAPRLLCDGQQHCHTGSCLYSEMIDRVCDILQNSIDDFELQIKNDDGDSVKLHENLVKSLEKKLKDLEAKELSQWEAKSHPDPSQRMPPEIFKRLNEKLLQEKDETQKALCAAYESQPEPVNYAEKLVKFKSALDALKNPDVDAATKNRLLKACIERIDYHRDRPERIKSQQIRYYDKEQKRTRHKSPLPTGGNWTTPPIELDVKLKL